MSQTSATTSEETAGAPLPRFPRYLFVVAGTVYLFWWGFVRFFLPNAFNPLASRLAVCAIFFALFAASHFVRLVQAHLSRFFAAGVCILTAHYYYLFSNNPGDLNWVAGSYITVLGCGVLLDGATSLGIYTFMVLGASAYVALHDPTTVVGVPGMATVLVLVNIVAFLRGKADGERRKRLKAEAEKAAAATVNRAKVQFLANMSHELRTPLTSILGCSDLLAETGELSGDSQDMLARVRGSSRHLFEVVDQILTMTQEDLAELKIEDETLDVKSLLESEAAKLTAERQAKALNLVIDYNIPTVVRVTANKSRVRRIVGALLNNSVKFTSQGSIIVTAALLEGPEHKAQLALTVRDSGIGIAKELWERCFEPFSQAQEGLDRPFGGTGLGLTIARKLARGMGGDVVIVASTPGKGTTIRATLDVARS